MTPEQAAYCVLHDFDRGNPDVKRIMDANDAEMTADHERLLREDADYAQRWHAGLKEFANRIDEEIAAKVYANFLKERR